MSAFVAIDVETADPWPGSICQIGLVGFEGGALARRNWLVDPGRPFDPVVSAVHGINAARVAGAPRFGALHAELMAALSGRVVVSYTDFDARAIGSACLAAGLAAPESFWLDGCALARAAWPDAASHKLRAIGAGLGIVFSDKHDAEQDALAAAYIALKGLKVLGLTAPEAAPRFAIRDVRVSLPPAPRRVAPVGAGWGGALRAAAGVPDTLVGEVVVFTGDMPFSREEMAERVAALGGTVRGGVTGKTTLIVSGWPTPEAGGQKLKSAADRIMDGQAIRYCTPSEFEALLARLG